jgi:hypothetical protein
MNDRDFGAIASFNNKRAIERDRAGAIVGVRHRRGSADRNRRDQDAKGNVTRA